MERLKVVGCGLWVVGLGVGVLGGLLSGCGHLKPGNDGMVQSYSAPTIEAGWIRNGELIEFEGFQWFPADDVENLMDSEVYQVGEYKGVQIFVEKTDIKPYQRLYTKFARGRFRYFERRND